jgi:hypothetical protein
MRRDLLCSSLGTPRGVLVIGSLPTEASALGKTTNPGLLHQSFGELKEGGFKVDFLFSEKSDCEPGLNER